MRDIVITGPTASGKTARAVALAQILNGEIVSADSRQVYKRMDIGTGKDIHEYGHIQYHLIDIVPAGEKYNLFRYLNDANRAISDIKARGCTPIVCGGTGMYLEALIKGTALPQVPHNDHLRTSLADKSLAQLTEILASMKTLHNTTDVDTRARALRAIEIQTFYQQNPELNPDNNPAAATTLNNPLIVAIDIDRQTRRQRITKRLHDRIQQGLIAEVQSLLDSGIEPEALIYYGLEYKFVTLHLMGQLDRDTMINQLEIAIHQFAKRQMTWFRGMERRGFTLHWIPWDVTQSQFNDTVVNLLNTKS